MIIWLSSLQFSVYSFNNNFQGPLCDSTLPQNTATGIICEYYCSAGPQNNGFQIVFKEF